MMTQVCMMTQGRNQQSAAPRNIGERQLRMSYQDKVAKCISEIRECEKVLNKKLSELNKLLKMDDAAKLAINDDTAMANSFPQQSFIGGIMQ